MGHTVSMVLSAGCLFVLTARAQSPRQDPILEGLQSARDARTQGRFDDAAARREEARRLLDSMPAGAPQFVGLVQSVSAAYRESAMTARARSIVQNALDRTAPLGEVHPTRIALLGMMAESWEQDRNLLKALSYLERASSVLESMSPAQRAQAARIPQIADGRQVIFISGRSFSPPGYNPDLSQTYQRLADMYRQLGRPDDVAKTLTRLRAIANDRDNSLAWFFDRQGLAEEAAAIYRRQVERAASPEQQAEALKSLADFYSGHQQYGEAVPALRAAVATLESSGTAASANQLPWMRQSLARTLQQAGRTVDADQVYQQLLASSRSTGYGYEMRALTSYVSHLGSTDRGEQAEDLLKQYRADHPGLQPWQEASLLRMLASVARASGAEERSESYAAAIQKQPAVPESMERPGIGTDLHKAQQAAFADNVDEAVRLSLEAIDDAPRSADREQIAWTVPQVAAALAEKKHTELAERLYQRVFTLVESWSADTVQPLLTVAENYCRFLMSQPERWRDVPVAIDRYRTLLVAAHGEDSGMLTTALSMNMEFDQLCNLSKAAMDAAQESLAFEESLSGATSEPYLRAIQRTVTVYANGGNKIRASELRRKEVAIADLVYLPDDVQRATVRINLAHALAVQGAFDEAEQLADEAVAIGRTTRISQLDYFIGQRARIRQMRPLPTSTQAERLVAHDL